MGKVKRKVTVSQLSTHLRQYASLRDTSKVLSGDGVHTTDEVVKLLRTLGHVVIEDDPIPEPIMQSKEDVFRARLTATDKTTLTDVLMSQEVWDRLPVPPGFGEVDPVVRGFDPVARSHQAVQNAKRCTGDSERTSTSVVAGVGDIDADPQEGPSISAVACVDDIDDDPQEGPSTAAVACVGDSDNETQEEPSTSAVDDHLADCSRWHGVAGAKTVKVMRTKYGLNRQFSWQSGDKSIFDVFFRRLCRISISIKHAKTQTSKMSKLAYFVLSQTKVNPEKPIDYTYLLHRDHIMTYLDRLQNMKGDASCTGLHAASMKNEYDALMNFLKFVKLEVPPQDQVLHTHLVILQQCVEDLRRANGKKISRENVQKVQHGRKTLPDCSQVHESWINDKVRAKLAEVERKNKVRRRIVNPRDYNFYVGFCLNYCANISVQRIGTITGMTLEEFENAEAFNKDGDDFWVVSVSNHKTGHRKVSELVLPDWGYKKLLLYKQVFRPETKSVHFFVRFGKGDFDAKGSIIQAKFQQNWGLRKITNTQTRHIVINHAATHHPQMMPQVAEAACHTIGVSTTVYAAESASMRSRDTLTTLYKTIKVADDLKGSPPTSNV